MIPGFSTRVGWERGWKSCMANSKDWRSENVNAIELKGEFQLLTGVPILWKKQRN